MLPAHPPSDRDGIRIRPATAADVPALQALIVALATYERAAHAVRTTEASLLHDGFATTPPLFEALVAEQDGRLLGMSLWYWRYSTWKGKRLYLEDLFVVPEARGLGIGKALLDATVAAARVAGATGLMWQVLDWNEPAIAFYRAYGATVDGGWLNCHMEL